jgi:hypothetical protein
MDGLEVEGLAMQLRLRSVTLIFPRENIGEVFVVA